MNVLMYISLFPDCRCFRPESYSPRKTGSGVLHPHCFIINGKRTI
jgi:hypothetical protein